MNCCDDYGNCQQGRNCPVRIAKENEQYKETADLYILITLLFVLAYVGAISFWSFL